MASIRLDSDDTSGAAVLLDVAGGAGGAGGDGGDGSDLAGAGGGSAPAKQAARRELLDIDEVATGEAWLAMQVQPSAKMYCTSFCAC